MVFMSCEKFFNAWLVRLLLRVIFAPRLAILARIVFV